MERFAIDLAFVVLVAGLVHAGWLAACLATRRYQLAASSILTAGALCLVIAVAAAATSAASGPSTFRFEQLVVPAALAAWLAMRVGASVLLRDRAFYGYAGCHVLLLAAATWQFQLATATRADSLESPAAIAYPMVEVKDTVLVTDEGRIFSTFRFDPRELPYDERSVTTYLQVGHRSRPPADKEAQGVAQVPSLAKLSRLQVAPPDGTTNCHGWAFAGEYALSEVAVEALLRDNGYALVSAPAAGDVVVYRDAAGAIVHSGRVRRVHSPEEVWIESKWGLGSRYIHLPLDQCYSDRFEYYRATRPYQKAQLVKVQATSSERQIASSGRTRPRENEARSRSLLQPLPRL